MSSKPLLEHELLVPFEIQHLPCEYKRYYLAKRQNFFSSIQGFRETWDLYLLLDKIILREFADMKVASSPSRVFPLLLYVNAHAKMRASMELALSGCLAEARSILRDAIEFVAHAHHMLKDPELQKTGSLNTMKRKRLRMLSSATRRLNYLRGSRSFTKDGVICPRQVLMPLSAPYVTDSFTAKMQKPLSGDWIIAG